MFVPSWRHISIIFQNSFLPDWHGSLRAPPSFPPLCRSNPRWRKPEAPGGPTRTPGARGSPGRDRRRSQSRLEKIIKPRSIKFEVLVWEIVRGSSAS